MQQLGPLVCKGASGIPPATYIAIGGKLSDLLGAASVLQQQHSTAVRAFSSNNPTDEQFFRDVKGSGGMHSQSGTAENSSAAWMNNTSDKDYFEQLSKSSSPEAVTSKGADEREQSAAGQGQKTVFTGTAEVQADREQDVPTDSNRRWMSADDLGTRATAATENAGGNQSETDAEFCHPADAYCQAGEKAPMPDGFHEPEPGDDHIPPSSGFPA